MSSASSSPTRAVVALVSSPDPQEWQPILHASNQVVLYNPRSHALTISKSNQPSALSSVVAKRVPRSCPYCKQTIPPMLEQELYHVDELEHVHDDDDVESIHTDDPAYHARAANYFQLLAVANETASRPASPPALFDDEEPAAAASEEQSSAFPADNMAEGYFQRFFQEEYKLGMGASGSVYLCQHVLDGNPLGHFAVKKIAVGESHSYLIKILREVRLLEQLHHPNIVTYHHAWLETSQFSAFGPRVPTLHVLMQWAEGGSLDDFIDIRLGRRVAHPHIHPLPNEGIGRLDADIDDSHETTPTRESGLHSRSARIRAFRAFQRAKPEERERMMKEGYGRPDGPEQRKSGKQWTPVHLLSADEVKSLFHDVVEGLGFLHNKSILHLDLKPGNVLLTWDDGRLIPRAMLSDFGTSRDMINSGRFQRSGNTGTLEYTSPESLPSPETGILGQIDSKSDMWSLGMILHKMLFFKLPYQYAAEGDANGEPVSLDRSQEGEKMARLEREVLEYPGFKGTPALVAAFETRRLPRTFIVLLEGLLHRTPSGRPSCDRVATAIREGKLDPLRPTPRKSREANLTRSPDALVPRARARSRSSSPKDGNPQGSPPPSSSSERTKLLSLPPSAEQPPPPDDGKPPGPSGWLMSVWNARCEALRSSRTWKTVDRAMRSRRGRFSMKLVRSLVLVSKVLSLPRLCPSLDAYPRPEVLALLVGAAVADTVIEEEPWDRGVLVSLGLAALHVGVLS
ncbi:hypothetical protein H1R20_g7635, partial [Candolleomyces eurysporus]